MRLLAAIRFLTKIPIPWKREDWNDEGAMKAYAHSAVFYPLVGLLIGVILAASYWILNLFMPPLLSATLTVVLMVLLTGGLHLDGLADTFDGLAAAHKGEGMGKEVMRRPDIGAIGVIVLVLLLLTKIVTLGMIEEQYVYGALIIIPVLGRWAMLFAIYFYPYARKEGMGKEIKAVFTLKYFILATLTMSAICLVVKGWIGVLLIVATILLVILVAGYMKGKFTGLTGDNYGTINEFSETLVLVIIVVASYNQWL